MFRQWLRSVRPSRERNPLTRRPRSFVPRVEGLEGRDVPSVTAITSGLEGSQGSAVGPGGYLYVTEGAAGRLSRVNVRTGAVTTVASGLPIGIWGGLGGGAIDVAFHGSTPYVLVTAVAADLGGTDVVGIYRVDGPSSFTAIADIGAWSIANPPETDIFVPTGNQYAMEPYRGGFLVTDGHHNRVLDVRLDGTITEVIAFDNLVPTGLAVRGNTVYVAQAGPVPHLPENGKVVSFRWNRPTATEVAAGAPLISDAEFGQGNTLYGLSMGVWDGVFEGDPPLPDTGAFLRVNGDGTFTVLEDGINRPTSLEFIRGTAYIVTFDGEVLRIDDVAGPHSSRAAGARSGDDSLRGVDGKARSSSGGFDAVWWTIFNTKAEAPANGNAGPGRERHDRGGIGAELFRGLEPSQRASGGEDIVPGVIDDADALALIFGNDASTSDDDVFGVLIPL